MAQTQDHSEEPTTEKDTLTGADSPAVGAVLEDRTHRAHARYAATNQPGVIFYDPRDGRERLALEASGDDLETLDERVLTSVSIKPYQPADAGRPAEKYVVKRGYAKLDLYQVGGPCTPRMVYPGSVSDPTVVDGLEAAREFCREHVDGYADAPRRDVLEVRCDNATVAVEPEGF